MFSGHIEFTTAICILNHNQTIRLRNEPLKKGPSKKDQTKSSLEPKKQLKKNSYSELFGLTAIILLGILVYSNSFTCSFHFDDLPRLVDNPGIRNLSDVNAWWNIYPTRPVGMFTFALDYHFHQFDVRYYHLVNLIIHLINACLVWWFTLLIFSSPALQEDPVSRQKKIIAFFTALLFVSHPLATQSVTYIIQRLTSMAALFYLLSLVLYLKARFANRSDTSAWLLFTGSVISAILSMGTKENAFTLPLAIVLLEVIFLRTKRLSINFKDYRVILSVLAFLGLIIFILLTFSLSIFNPIPPTYWGNSYTLTPLNYLFTQFSVILKYIQLLILPLHQNVDYDFPVSDNFFTIRTILSFLVLLSLFILAILFYKRYRIISFGIFWFFLMLSVESGIIPIIDVIFEHRTYLPSFGFFLILSWCIYILFWNKYKFIAVSVFLIIIASNSWLTFERNKVWKDEVTLWSDAVSKSPGKARPVYNLGIAHLKSGQMEMAVADFTRLIEINPKLVTAYTNRGDAYFSLGQWDKVIADYSRVIDLDPKSTDTYYNRGIAYGNLGQSEKAIADYTRAIGIDPTNVKAYSNRGVAYGNSGQWDNAIADYTRAIGIDPTYAGAYYNRGIAYGNNGQVDLAIADYSKTLEVNPRYAAAYSNRGVAYSDRGQWDKAISDYSKAIQIEPNYRDAYLNRGIAYYNLRQYEKAISEFSMALQIDPNSSLAYSNREAAYIKLQSEKR
jgi:protein O-mannosyl-transferase